MNLISKETQISKGKVHYLIKNWKERLEGSDIEKIREFSNLVKSSNVSIEQCAQGFRIINILKSFGIGNLDISDDSDGNDAYKDIDNHTNDNYNEFFSFVKEIYNNCKKLEISPAIITSWVKDLVDFRSFIIDANNKVFEGDDDDGYSIILPTTATTTTTTLTQEQEEEEQENNLKDFQSPINEEINNYNLDKKNERTNPFIESLPSNLSSNQSINSSSSSLTTELKIPFVSQVSFFISEKKKEIEILNNNQKTIEKNLKSLKEQESKTVENLNTIIQKEKFAISYINWFSNLEQSLQQNYNIDIKKDIQSFSKLINDFKQKGYYAEDILQEYLKSLSLKLEIKTNEDKIQSLQGQISQLTEQVSYLESKINQHKMTLDRYSHLEAMGFGLTELRQLWNNILEIAEANNISYREAVSKFLKDIEEQYDSKLGFEKKVNEKRGELALINRDLNNSRQNLFLNPLVGPSLSNLLQKGIGEQDIININQLVETIIAKESIMMDKSDNNNRVTNSNSSRSEYWKTLIEELKKYENIKVAIKEKQKSHDNLQKQINYLDKQKQEILKYLQMAISIIYTINNTVYYYKGFTDQFNKDLNYRNNSMSSSLSRLFNPFIFIINNNNNEMKKDKEEGDDNAEKKDKENSQK